MFTALFWLTRTPTRGWVPKITEWHYFTADTQKKTKSICAQVERRMHRAQRTVLLSSTLTIDTSAHRWATINCGRPPLNQQAKLDQDDRSHHSWTLQLVCRQAPVRNTRLVALRFPVSQNSKAHLPSLRLDTSYDTLPPNPLGCDSSGSSGT